ncbi:Tyrosine-protein kinase etk [Sporotomaculum syntrophicum]|uniref:Tyrosine-protein kinase etk n=1 Tax=Sporotomaculum syntrophicum TaxID=182264 RepID=A0A9D2WSE5_9FIRM|nr:GNVR domain-containing protein [Sporotomaculum syntrophicum]KAF1086071.1 Tyrosine-protein kinase etk [Sporotomaculum syntrophicum]
MEEKQDYVESDVIDLRQILEVLRKWRWLIIAISSVALTISVVMSYFVIDPVYEAKSMLVVTMPVTDPTKFGTTGQANTDDLESVISTVSRMPVMTMNTYVGQLTSDTMYERTVKRLGLDKQGYSGKNLAGMVRAEVAKDSNIIMLKVQHTDPRLASDVANGLAEEYLAYLSEENERKMTQSTEFLSVQKAETEQQLNKLLTEMKNFNAGSTSVEFMQKQFEILTTDLNTYQNSLDAARVQVAQLQSAVNSLRDRLNSTPQKITTKYTQPADTFVPVDPAAETEPVQPPATVVTEEQINPVYLSLSEQLSAKETELAEKKALFTANQNTVTRLKSELAALQSQLSSKQIDQQKLQNEINRLQETQNLLAQKVTQTQIARSIDMGNTTIDIASPALVPSSPVKPNKQMNVAVALVLGLMISVGLAFLLEFMDNTIKSPDDVQKHLGLPVMGTIPSRQAEGKSSRRFFRLRRN